MSSRRPWSVISRGAPLRACAALVLSLTVCCVAAPAAVAAGGLGAGSAFSELTKREPETTTAQTTATQSTESRTSNSITLLWVGGAAAVALLGGIALAIVRDARRVAPAGDAQLAEASSRGYSAARLRRRRAQAKAARRARKRNR